MLARAMAELTRTPHSPGAYCCSCCPREERTPEPLSTVPLTLTTMMMMMTVTIPQLSPRAKPMLNASCAGPHVPLITSSQGSH